MQPKEREKENNSRAARKREKSTEDEGSENKNSRMKEGSVKGRQRHGGTATFFLKTEAKKIG